MEKFAHVSMVFTVTSIFVICEFLISPQIVFGPERIGQLSNIYASPVGASGRVYIIGRPLSQGLQYSDTPIQPLAEMRFTDSSAPPGPQHRYRVIAENTAGLKSRQ